MLGPYSVALDKFLKQVHFDWITDHRVVFKKIEAPQVLVQEMEINGLVEKGPDGDCYFTPSGRQIALSWAGLPSP